MNSTIETIQNLIDKKEIQKMQTDSGDFATIMGLASEIQILQRAIELFIDESHEEAIIEGQNRVFNSPIEAARQAAFTAYISVDGNLRYAAMKAYRAKLIDANINCSVNSAYQAIDAMGLHAKSS